MTIGIVASRPKTFDKLNQQICKHLLRFYIYTLLNLFNQLGFRVTVWTNFNLSFDNLQSFNNSICPSYEATLNQWILSTQPQIIIIFNPSSPLLTWLATKNLKVILLFIPILQEDITDIELNADVCNHIITYDNYAARILKEMNNEISLKNIKILPWHHFLPICIDEAPEKGEKFSIFIYIDPILAHDVELYNFFSKLKKELKNLRNVWFDIAFSSDLHPKLVSILNDLSDTGKGYVDNSFYPITEINYYQLALFDLAIYPLNNIPDMGTTVFLYQTASLPTLTFTHPSITSQLIENNKTGFLVKSDLETINYGFAKVIANYDALIEKMLEIIANPDKTLNGMKETINKTFNKRADEARLQWRNYLIEVLQ